MAASVEFDTSVGKIKCDVVGDLFKSNAVILTVHDLGCNGTSWNHFVEHPSVEEITKRVTWLHINIPGHENDAEDLPQDYKFPSMDELAAAVSEISSKITCPVIGLGEGAGANILARLALTEQKTLHGVVLIHCTSTTAGFLESMQDKMINFRLLGGMNPTAENYLVMHRFGDFSHAENADQVKAVVDEFRQQLNQKVNPRNVRQYIDCFMHRTNIAEKISGLRVPMLLITGNKASHNHTVHTLHNAIIRAVTDRKRVEFIEIENVANVVEGAPERLSEALLYFAQGCGVLGGAPMTRVRSSSHPNATMEQLDKSDL